MDAAFGTMAGDFRNRNILAARDAWQTLTGDPLAPERVYKLAGLVADIVGVTGAIEAVNTQTLEKSSTLEDDPSAYDEDFDLDDPGYIVRLVKQVATVSVKTVELVKELTEAVTAEDWLGEQVEAKEVESL